MTGRASRLGKNYLACRRPARCVAMARRQNVWRMESLPLSCCDPVLMLCSVAHDLAKGRHPPRQCRVNGRALQPYAQRIADNAPSPFRGWLAALLVSETLAECKARAMNGVVQALALRVRLVKRSGH